ncbi:MAG: hypothetical protein UDR62_05405 [Lachnospiraceae bacterium]|uniref:Uncharacterized protein n=1 Tax=Maccoyibacter intestinihominis TaxID=3133499 RepID=A0ABV1HF74_9FIRM|nr:hypothetical protein [Lachnospiraceae bacterium]MEE0391126.1 hypothetical protein [Lachnospiraceae bacterium]MEE0513847.1 hypothetical protein [Lachnospiraceae bacterium]
MDSDENSSWQTGSLPKTELSHGWRIEVGCVRNQYIIVRNP